MKRYVLGWLLIICFNFSYSEDILSEDGAPLKEISVCRVEVVPESGNAQFQEFFGELLSVESFPARWVCGDWTNFHGWLYILSDLVTFLAYFAIPAILFIFIYRRINVYPFRTALIFFVSFIFICGLTHLIDAIIFWFPLYRLSALLRFLTATISVGTVFVLVQNLPTALKYKSPAQLEKEVEKRTKELDNKNNELEVLSHMLSHDIKSPLSNISGLVHLLNQRADGFDDDTKEMLGYLNQSVEKSFEKIEEANELMRLASSRTSEYKEISITEEIYEVIKAYEFIENFKKIRFNIDIENDKFHTNPIGLGSILQNLIGNAVKYGDQTADLTISISQAIRNGKNVLSVEDNGPGIDLEKEKDRVFKLYQRFDKTKEGTGIGLYLVKQHVEKMGGSISIESKVGEGTRFIMIFPLSEK